MFVFSNSQFDMSRHVRDLLHLRQWNGGHKPKDGRSPDFYFQLFQMGNRESLLPVSLHGLTNFPHFTVSGHEHPPAKKNKKIKIKSAKVPADNKSRVEGSLRT